MIIIGAKGTTIEFYPDGSGFFLLRYAPDSTDVPESAFTIPGSAWFYNKEVEHRFSCTSSTWTTPDP